MFSINFGIILWSGYGYFDNYYASPFNYLNFLINNYGFFAKAI